MCIIIGGLKKDLKEKEQLQGMNTNNYGFSICVIRQKGKAVDIKVTRSLKQDDIMKVWRKAKNDDYVVTHSRIPSCGGMNANIADVHGWQREGVTFFHNGTMSNIKSLMKPDDKRTDSLYFFEEIFIPLYVSRGRVFDDVIEKTCNAIAHGSRLCFVLPDGTVKYIGEFINDHDCLFSNRGYRGYEFTSMTGYQKGMYGGHTTRSNFCNGQSDEEAYASWWHNHEETSTVHDKDTKVVDLIDDEDDAPTALDMLGGPSIVIPLLLERIAYRNVLTTMTDEVAGESRDIFSHLQSMQDDGDYNLSLSDDYLAKAPFETERVLTKDDLQGLVVDYADELLEDLDNEGVSSMYMANKDFTETAVHAIKDYLRYTVADSKMVNLVFNWTETNKIGLTGLATAFKLDTSPSGVPFMSHRPAMNIWTSYEEKDNKSALANIAMENLRHLYRMYEEACKKKEE